MTPVAVRGRNGQRVILDVDPPGNAFEVQAHPGLLELGDASVGESRQSGTSPAM